MSARVAVGTRAAFAATAAIGLTLGSTASAQTAPVQRGFDVDTFDPAARGSDWLVLDSLDFRDDGRGALGVVGEYAYKPLVVKNGDGDDRASVVADQFVVHPGASLIILDRLRLSADLPIVAASHGTSTTLGGVAYDAPDKASLGDGSIAADVRLFGRYGEVATGSLGLEAIAPTGSPTLYTGDGKTRLVPRIQLAGITRDVEWAARGGVLFRIEDEVIDGLRRGDAIVFGGSVGYRADHDRLLVGPEVYGSTSFTHASRANTPIEALASVHYRFAPSWRAGLGVGPGFGSALGAPLLRTVLSIELAPPAEPHEAPLARPPERPLDSDRDGIPDDVDACPEIFGVASAEPSANGCPSRPDGDRDGVPDGVDACPDIPGVADPNPARNGCPADADDDGIPDAEDKCPLLAGVKAPGEQNGCPPDRDHDGVPDAVDACPDVPGAVSKTPEDNGCPFDPDRDHDGIPNDADACPHEFGPKDPDPTRNGCPKAILRGDDIRILEQVRFDAGSARITPGRSTSELFGAIARIFVAHAEITKVEVQGHTDSQGNPKANKKLSEERAKAVVKALVAQGIDPSRLTAVGYGDERPIDSNASDSGRKANRRVELHVIARAPTRAPKGGEP